LTVDVAEVYSISSSSSDLKYGCKIIDDLGLCRYRLRDMHDMSAKSCVITLKALCCDVKSHIENMKTAILPLEGANEMELACSFQSCTQPRARYCPREVHFVRILAEKTPILILRIASMM